ncbi:hypothetical protein E2C01_071282 [Portunus trituberculatus]|uniref:Uncharacterized protein n=1 Tax=Portunus trituberculatus TaxID=210409 RepID=A0A5B7I7K3_PORTR|nr:hypothetical protein [Portunus trituberculatus]
MKKTTIPPEYPQLTKLHRYRYISQVRRGEARLGKVRLLVAQGKGKKEV